MNTFRAPHFKMSPKRFTMANNICNMIHNTYHSLLGTGEYRILYSGILLESRQYHILYRGILLGKQTIPYIIQRYSARKQTIPYIYSGILLASREYRYILFLYVLCL